MIRNFLRIAIRNISKHKVFTFINISGLATGLAASLLILLWVQNELSYERYNEDAENIYRVEEDQFYSGDRYHVTVTPHPSGPEWKDKIPEIVEQTRISGLPRLLFRLEDKVFFESSLVAVDSGFLKIFTLPLLTGDPETALSSPHSIILSEKLAVKYFGDSDPIGKYLTIENQYSFMVTGVMKKPPHNSMFDFEGLVPYTFLKERGAYNDSWGTNSIQTFVKLANNSDTEAVNNKLTSVVVEHMPETTIKYSVFPLLDIHLHQQFGFEESNGPVVIVYIFTLIAVFVLLIACINFINLTTARASSRDKEIVIKKVSGADRLTMIMQFMFESLLMVIIAMVLALLLAALLLDIFSEISGQEFTLKDLLKGNFILSIIAVGLTAAIISGIYPALYLSSFNPVSVLKGKTLTGKGNGRLRQALVVVQFTLSIVIAISAVFIYMQMEYLRDKNLGFEKNDLIYIPMADDMKEKYYSLKDELQNETLILGVTACNQSPVRIFSNAGGADWEGKDPEKNVLVGTNTIDYDYLETMKMELVSGRDFSRDYTSDMARDTTGNFLINEEVARIMDIGDPVGKSFRFMGLNGKIIGVLKNFHFKGADQKIEPIAFALTDINYLNNILIRLTPGNIPSSLQTVERVWNEIIPEFPLEYSFIDQDYYDLYRSQMHLSDLLRYFTFLAVIIACMGLYGLSSYATERRTNEIGVRKVMGADVLAILGTFSKEFLILIIISIILAVPAGYIIVNNLLKQFPYRIETDMLVFIAIALGATLITIITISFHAYKATRINPAEALKIE